MVQLKLFHHRQQLCVGIMGSYNAATLKIIRSISDIAYSATHSCFYAPHSPDSLRTIERAWTGTEKIECINDDLQQAEDPISANVAVAPGFIALLTKLRYSRATIQNYQSQFSAFLQYIYPVTAEDIGDQHVDAYMLYLIQDRKVSLSTQNQAINAVKFYLERVCDGARKVYRMERPRSEVKLPTVLSEEEVSRLRSLTTCIRHGCDDLKGKIFQVT